MQGVTETAVAATKVDAILVGNDGDGLADAGDVIRYTVWLTNVGDQDAESVYYVEDLEPNTALLDETVTTTQGTFVSGDYNLAVNVGTIPAASSVTITFDVVVRDPLPAGVTQVSNQGVVSGTNFTAVMTDDPDTAPLGDPTITPADAPAPAAVIVMPTSGLVTTEAGGQATFTVVLATVPTADVMIDLASSDRLPPK